MRRISYKLLCFICTCFFVTAVHADDLSLTDISELSFEELLDQVITTPSKQPEKVFSSPLSSTVLTKEEIANAGATSIPEALRLVPGVIVREQTNGVYDVHIRGFDHLSPGSIFTRSVNSLTLVMIDNRVVYNYQSGGTFWESLPVDLHDVESIEVVRGPASVLYGPNAVTGVIHILTKEAKEKGAFSEAHIEGGRHDTGIIRGRAGYSWGDSFAVTISGHGQQRDRQRVEYYSFADGDYKTDPKDLSFVTVPRPLSNADERFPDPEQSLERAGANIFLESSPAEDISLEFDAGYQDSTARSVFHDIDSTPLTTSNTDSYYVHSRNRIGNAGVIVSYLDGEQQVKGAPESSYEFKTFDFSTDYLFELDAVSLRPGFAYRRVEYGGGRYEEGDPELDLWAGSLQGQWTAGDVTLMGGARADQYDYRSKTFVSYQAVVEYTPGDLHSFRLGYGRGYRSPFMEELYQVITFPVNETTAIQGLGSEDLDLVTNDTVEAGWRTKISEHINSDFEVFWSRNKDYASIFADGTTRVDDGITFINFPYQQVPLEAEQWGATWSLLYASEAASLYGRIFATVQRTHLDQNYTTPLDPTTEADGEHENTPNWYGGFHVNWLPLEKWNFNLSGYMYSDSTQVAALQTTDVAGKVLLNLKASYALTKYTKVFFNGRNILNNNNREFANTDQIDGLYLGGLEINLD